ncbi:MAG: Pyridoxamine 5'-phosphate oxidase [Methanosaeta sp. PtaB.Bin039]|nr:MAG: Pyridoxamine 5'-phosphate oxidase [Methanosaeta sp. PtaB.Bin039]OPY46639.1 MAG: Pyridoxamine 5'-phosphate oxidase [Methanosaeta sp. PtaU1.Bin028]HOT05984.1 pyridoxamine 5'-phosphate oxidase family protein [Methanotrichaceae archaeon]HQF16812.1 pyridoxamine 5'-phosphate oxidase family protein [Methanotrichaceae archaeon]HQI90138.1 pyridoxamine 5'-phosphate oxidase family protein [Methanotrichaceae archaeon]
MGSLKLPRMEKAEYDRLIEEEHICRIAFRGESHPHIAPFLYTFDKRHMYFISTRYGRKIRYFGQDPRVSVEVERYSPDLSSFCFVTLRGSLALVEDADQARAVRQSFVDLIRHKEISPAIMVALGLRPDQPPEALFEADDILIWRLVRVVEIIALKNG